jgi:hypothetical protein
LNHHCRAGLARLSLDRKDLYTEPEAEPNTAIVIVIDNVLSFAERCAHFRLTPSAMSPRLPAGDLIRLAHPGRAARQIASRTKDRAGSQDSLMVHRVVRLRLGPVVADSKAQSRGLQRWQWTGRENTLPRGEHMG